MKALFVAVVGAVILAIPGAASACPCCDHHHRSEHASQRTASAPALPPGEARVTIPVAGMHCAHCVSRVQDALGRVDGVRLAEASLDSGEAVVVYDKSKVKPAKLVEAIDGAGFKAGTPRD